MEWGRLERLAVEAILNAEIDAVRSTWNVPVRRPLADFAPTIILKAKDFAAEITIHNARDKKLHSERSISAEHITNNRAVRTTLLGRGIRPEALPAAEDIKKVERRLASDAKKSLQKPERLQSDSSDDAG